MRFLAEMVGMVVLGYALLAAFGWATGIAHPALWALRAIMVLHAFSLLALGLLIVIDWHNERVRRNAMHRLARLREVEGE